MLASGVFWRFTAFRFRNLRQRIHLQPKPSRLYNQSTERSAPDGESRYFAACFAGEKMSTHGDGTTVTAGRDMCLLP